MKKPRTGKSATDRRAVGGPAILTPSQLARVFGGKLDFYEPNVAGTDRVE